MKFYFTRQEHRQNSEDIFQHLSIERFVKISLYHPNKLQLIFQQRKLRNIIVITKSGKQ